MSIVSTSMAPTEAPTSAYASGPEVLAVAYVVGQPVVLEIFRRPSGTIGFRYSAWVAWRDADDIVRGHSWWQHEPAEAIVTDLILDAQRSAETFATSNGVEIRTWYTT